MIDISQLTVEPHSLPFWLLQVPVPVPAPVVPVPVRAAEAISSVRFFEALIAGIVLAFAFQLLLTNLSVAAGISYLGRKSDDDSDSDRHDSGSFGGTINKVSKTVGIWTLVTVTLSLFLACFLAVNLSLLTFDVGLGAILGLVIWGAYFSLLVWASSTTVGSLIGSIVNTATSGFQAILGTATAALGAKAASNQVVATAEAAAAAVGRQIGSAIDPVNIRHSLEDYLETLRPADLDVKAIRREFESLLASPDLRSISPENLKNINRDTFVDLVSKNTNLSKRDANRIVDQLEGAWKQATNRLPQRDVMGELVDYLKSAQAKELKSPESAKLDELIAEMRSSRQATQEQTDKAPGLFGQARQMAMTAITGALMGRTDLSDLDIQSILNRLKEVKDQAVGGAKQLTGQPQPTNTIRLDIENYLINAYPWQLNREAVRQEFRDVIYDAEADPIEVRRQLEQIKRQDFFNILQEKGLLTQDEINQITDRLESTRQEVLTSVIAAEEREKIFDLRRRVENYLRYTPKEQLNTSGILSNFKPLLEDTEGNYEQLQVRFAQLDRATLLQILYQRADITPTEADAIVNDLERTRDLVASEAKGLQ
ncbi:MAG TPA: hypothetical protein DCY88_27345, partial [Cyanobacteria bacterium UBA11372]|nr:hypothetical protein [Cyanobacteria bacterium UBA11372]